MKDGTPVQKPMDGPGSETSRNETVGGELGSLLSEASALMKSLRPSLKMLNLKKTNPQEVQTGLLDGGATNALRKGSQKELEKANEVTVELATGKATLFQDPITGTLLTKDDVEPIVPLRGVVELGYKIQWDASGCTIHHPTQGKLACWLRNGCPVVRETHAMKLIWEIENHETAKRSAPKLASEGVGVEVVNWWKKEFPEVPPKVIEYMKGQNDEKPLGSEVPWNRGVRKRLESAKAIVIHLFAGNSGYWKKGWPEGVEVLTVDIRENPHQDLNNPKVWSYLCWLVRNKPVLAIIGGPPCRSVSRLRNIRPGPRPLRDRSTFRFGLEGLTDGEKHVTNGDSALVLKQVALYKLSEEHKPQKDWVIGFLLESPEDPAGYAGESEAPSFWTWEEVRGLESYGMRVVSFDQGMLGHEQNKPTSCMTNLPRVLELNELRCKGNQGKTLNPTLEDRFQQTAAWAAWAVGLKAAIKESILWFASKNGFGGESLKRLLSREEWKQHIVQGHRPYRRDCRACVLDMASGPQHRRRQHGGSSAWSMGVDIVQFGKTRDDVTHVDVKYVVVATALVPRFDVCEPKPEPPYNGKEIVEIPDWGEGLDEEDLFGSDQEEGKKPPLAENVNGVLEEKEGIEGESPAVPNPEKEKDDPVQEEIEECQKPLKLCHVTMIEPVAGRSTNEVLRALTVLLVKMRSLGIHVYRLHGDRAKELLSHKTEQWCSQHGLIRTLGGGDDPANNGHVESEINQLKRRVRLLLRTAKQDWTKWPNAVRYASEQRLRTQLSSLGVSVSPMIPYAAQVVVKRKRWHDPGVLAPPYVEGVLLSPSPHMNVGWVVRTVDERIVHVREAIVPDPLGEEVAIQLQEEEREPLILEERDTPRRIVGKQSPEKKQKIPLPRAGTFGSFSAGQEDKEEFEPTPTTPPKSPMQDPEEPQNLMLSGGGLLGDDDLGDDDSLGEKNKNRICALGQCDLEKADLRKNGSLEGNQCALGQCDLEKADLRKNGSLEWNQRDLDQSDLEEKTGLRKGQPLCEGNDVGQNGDQEGLVLRNKGKKNHQERFFGSVVGNSNGSDPLLSVVGWRTGKELEKQWVGEHFGVSQVLDDFLKLVPTDEIEGSVYGWVVQVLNNQREGLEKGLVELGRVERVKTLRLCSVNGETKSSEETPESKEVLQTVTMSLSDVKKDLDSWIPAMRAEYESLTRETAAVLPVDVRSLNPQEVEFVPGKLVCVVKAGPNGGKKKCRGVICGNMMESDPSPLGVYASGADGTLIRTVLRHAALEHWGCSTTDIKTAFLLAPRVVAPQQREVVVVPPKILVEAGVCSHNERWKILKALYGLPSSPACWAKFRDETLKSFTWETKNGRVGMHQTPEGNLWKIYHLDGDYVGKMVGQVLVYVDDLMVVGPPEIRMSFLKRLNSEWTCAPVDHVEKGKWTRFSGLEVSLGEDGTSMKISQISYIKELLQRHAEIGEKSTPMPKWDTEGPPEENITPQQIREAQMVTGELLWAAVRSRPDISFSVSVMGQQVTKRPQWVCQLGKHVLGFLKSTWDHCLLYSSEVGGHGHDGILQIPRHEALIETYTDISFAPHGNRSYQGVLVFFAGAPVQWEANRQSFCTLSTAESELMATIEGMTMAQSVETLLQVMYQSRVHEKVLYCDNASAISILEKPDGPWRTRHLRLRANYLKEKLRHQPEEWKIRHQKGSTLVADLLTKPITQVAVWRRFWKSLSFLVSPKHEEVLNDEKGNNYETDGFATDIYDDAGNNANEEVSENKSTGEVFHETTVKIAKVGLLLGLVGKIPWNPEQCHVKIILIVVLTVLLSFFVVQWKKDLENSNDQPREVCRKLCVSPGMLHGKEEQEKKEGFGEKNGKRVRENEPTPHIQKEENGNDANPLEKGTQNFWSLGTPLKNKGKEGVAEVNWWERVAGSAQVFFFENVFGRSEVRRNPLSTLDGSSYYCPQGCPGRGELNGAIAMADSKMNPKVAALRMAHGNQGSDDQGLVAVPELWEEEKFGRPPKYNKDEWIDCWLERGWLIRSHGKERVRRFHPVHKGNPIHVDNLSGDRISIGFNNKGERVMRKDRWTDAPTNLFDPKQLWKGWTFLQLKQPMMSNLGQKFGGNSKAYEKGTADATSGGAEMPTSSSDPVTSASAVYSQVGNHDRLSLVDEAEIGERTFLTGQTKGYKKGNPIDKGQLVMSLMDKSPIPEEEDDEDWEKVSETS